MSRRGGWGRSRGPRKCGQRRTTDARNRVACGLIADGSHTVHRGREAGSPWRHFAWADGGPLRETDWLYREIRTAEDAERNEMTTETIHTFTCIECGEDYSITETAAAANGWTSLFDVRHIGCTVKVAPARDPFDWSKATEAEVNDMVAQMGGNENVSR